jgi:hypothetical protein
MAGDYKCHRIGHQEIEINHMLICADFDRIVSGRAVASSARVFHERLTGFSTVFVNNPAHGLG